MLIVAVAGLVAHAAALSTLGNAEHGPLISDSIQFLLGVLATLACIQAARSSLAYAAKVWWLSALALAIYTAGQGIVIYYDNVLHAPLFSPWTSDQFLFFWIVPLAMTGLLDRTAQPGKWDWALALDFCQVLLVALALHISVFALSSEWQSQGRQLAYLEWWVRMARDLIVLAVLWSKVALSTSAQTRSLFRRLGFFFLAYSLADGVYLYAEAAWQNYVGTWLDLLWSIPRALLVAGAATWKDEPESALEERPRRTRRQTLPLHLASILGPVMVVMVALRITSGAPVTAGILVALSFLCASVRFLITQDRQDRAAAELRTSRDLLEAIVEGTTEAIYVRDLKGQYIFANRAAKKFLEDSTGRDVLGRSNYDFFSEKSAERSRQTDLEVIESGHPKAMEEPMDVRGDTHVFLSRKAPYRDAQGTIGGVLGIAVDVTERRKMEEELRKAQRMESIGTLAGGVAHDFNNLLTVIKGYSQLLIEELNGTPAQDKLKQIESAAEK
ncbi:MAG TPA: PAS domain-containing protein, partial [Terriglobales bacterium]|nr:PAS domain-containing protein [Terriglobales bacterium]